VSDSEFLGAHPVRFWKEKVAGVILSCNGPSRKQDNRFVGHKNHTLVRAYHGPAWHGTPHESRPSASYQMWLHGSFLQPVMRVNKRTASPGLLAEGQPSRMRRRFD
jgi:hypothetical protein